MNAQRIFLTLILVGFGFGTLLGQRTQQERKLTRGYTSPEELVSMAQTTPLDRAFAVISEVSQKFAGKIIVDIERRTTPIGIDVQAMQWRDALDAICRANDLAYQEYQTYFQVMSVTGAEAAKTAAGGQPKPAGEIPREYASFHSREVKISAIFFEVNLGKLDEVGINWSFMKSNKDITINSNLNFGERVATEISKIEVTPKLSFANMKFLAKIFSNYDLGEILSNPQLIVRSGEEGRIQVGQDFSVKEKDFAGNLTDKFYSAGTIIKVKPQVIAEKGTNFVHMNVEVERSSVNPGTISTIINKTLAKTNILLLDGEETIIGGLYNNEASTLREGIPFLKDLPWYVLGLRYIFGHDKDQVQKKELVILLKADLVPTLDERMTQKKKEDGVFPRWREERQRDERHMKGREELAQ